MKRRTEDGKADKVREDSSGDGDENKEEMIQGSDRLDRRLVREKRKEERGEIDGLRSQSLAQAGKLRGSNECYNNFSFGV